MGFHEIDWPLDLSYGTSGGPGFKTSVVTLQSGAEEFVQHASRPKFRYLVRINQPLTDCHTLRTFYIARGGVANGFRFKDPEDYTSNADGSTAPTHLDQATVPTTGDGANTAFQIVKRYISGSQNTVRTITKIHSGSVLVSVNNVNQVSPGWSYPWSVDTTTGIITFTTPPPASQVVRAGYEFRVPVRFAEDIDEWMPTAYPSYQRGELSVPLVEWFNDPGQDDEFLYRGAATINATTSVSISKASGFALTFTSTGASSTCTLPAKAAIALGGPHWVLINGGANDLPIIDVDDASTVATLDPSGGTQPWCELHLGYTTAGARKWYAFG